MIMKKIRKYHSFAFLCAINIITYSLILFLFYSFIGYLTSSRLFNAFPTMYDLLQYEQQLLDEDYEDIPISRFNNASLIVFDDQSEKVVYSSDDDIVQKIQYDDLLFVRDYDSSLFYNVSGIKDQDGKTYYAITLEQYNDGDEFGNIYDQCILNENYEIVEGDLFANEKKLSARDLRLMQGQLNNKMNIDKISYESKNGKSKTAVLVSPVISDTAYNRILRENGKIWLYMVPLFLVLVLLQIYVFARITKKFFGPFTESIAHYRQGEPIDIDEVSMPMELRQTYQEFVHLTQELERAEEEKKQIEKDRQRIIASISHDLKTPLTVIKGFSSALLDHKVPDDERKRYLQTILSRSMIANDLIDALFAYNKLNHPEYVMNLHKEDICEFIKQFLAEKYQEISSKHFELEIDIPETEIICQIDRQMFLRLLENIIGNSLKYNLPKTTVFVSVYQEGNEAVISLGDNGIGIEKDLLQQIFEPFTMANEARSSGLGTGLGLSICKKIVELHSGTINAILPEDGRLVLEFIIRLPLFRE